MQTSEWGGTNGTSYSYTSSTQTSASVNESGDVTAGGGTTAFALITTMSLSLEYAISGPPEVVGQIGSYSATSTSGSNDGANFTETEFAGGGDTAGIQVADQIGSSPLGSAEHLGSSPNSLDTGSGLLSALGGEGVHAMSFKGLEILPTASPNGSSLWLEESNQPGQDATDWISHPSGIGYRRSSPGVTSGSGSHSSGSSSPPIPGNFPTMDNGTSDGGASQELARLTNFLGGGNENPGAAQPGATPRAEQIAISLMPFGNPSAVAISSPTDDFIWGAPEGQGTAFGPGGQQLSMTAPGIEGTPQNQASPGQGGFGPSHYPSAASSGGYSSPGGLRSVPAAPPPPPEGPLPHESPADPPDENEGGPAALLSSILYQAVFQALTPKKEDAYAGLEIGDELRLGLKILETEFKKLSPEQKLKIAKALRELQSGALQAWDIRGLLSEHIKDFRINGWGKWGTGKGVDTVTVDGKVYWAPAVNYILWGRINRLLYDSGVGRGDYSSVPQITEGGFFLRPPLKPLESHSLEWTLETAGIYRSIKNLKDGGGHAGNIAWTAVGWTGDWEFAADAVLTKPGINYIPSPIKHSGGLGWRVAPQPPFGRRAGSGPKGIIEFKGTPDDAP
jgi:hypothetical protein